MKVNWVGLSQTLHVTDSMDSNVRLIEAGPLCDFVATGCVPAFSDSQLASMIRAFRQRGIHVHLTLAIDDNVSSKAAHPAARWMLGQQTAVPGSIDPAYWPWYPTHPLHASFVAGFWAAYTSTAVHVAQIAEMEGVELFSLGTETDRLFHARGSGQLAYDYAPQLQTLVGAVRAVYSRKLGYDMSFDVLTVPSFWGGDADRVATDLGLDVAGVSAYFPLLPSPVPSVPTVSQLEDRFDSIFTQYLEPLRLHNPTLPVIFLEFGYVDSPQSPAVPNADEYRPFVFSDLNGNGIDDGRETQANVYEALFRSFERHPAEVSGAFLWGHDISTDAQWSSWYGGLRTFVVRQKPAEAVVKAHYTSWSAPAVTSIIPNGGSTAGGTVVSITGQNFTAPAVATFGGATATAVDVVSSTTITATTPPHAAGIVDVAVQSDSRTATLSDAYFYFTPVPPGRLYTLAPCRLIDTRDPPGPLGGPALFASSRRTFTVTDLCGIPTTARAISVNMTVTAPTAPGFLTLFPGDGIAPQSSNINFFAAQTRANSAVVLLATDATGRLAVLNGAPGMVDFILDVNGYFQ